MFDRLDDLVIRYEGTHGRAPGAGCGKRSRTFQKADEGSRVIWLRSWKLIRSIKKCKQNIEDSLLLLEDENPMRRCGELAKEELSDSRKRVEELEQELKILLLPKDPNDEKNVIVEVRAGAGGDEAALFAAEIYRMYVHYADTPRVEDRDDLFK